MRGIPYSTTEILYHNKVGNIHDFESYYTFLKLAWVDHSTLMVMMLLVGVCMGLLSSQYIYRYLERNNIIKVVD